MARNKIIITIIVLIVTAFAVVDFFSGNVLRTNILEFYNKLRERIGIQFNSQMQSFEETNIGSVVTKTGKKIFSPPPLRAGGDSDGKVILLQSQIIAETNLQRKENGDLPALVENGKLDQAASAKASDLFRNQYFEHVSPTGIDPGQLVQNYGYEYIMEGENLILGNFSSEKEVVQDWMNSKEHRENILNKRYTEIGVAIVRGTYKGKTVWIGVQEFGLPMSECAEPSSDLKNQIDSENSQLDNLSSEITERKGQLDSADKKSSAYGKMVDDYNELVSRYNSLVETIKELVSRYNNEVNNFNTCVAGN